MKNKYMLGMKYILLLCSLSTCAGPKKEEIDLNSQLNASLAEIEKNLMTINAENQRINENLEELNTTIQKNQQSATSDSQILHKRIDKECKMSGWTKTLVVGSCISVCFFSFVLWKFYSNVFH
ncbi:hypothetical protein [Alphaproteobacteria bacterium endosymbiont of Tiliacea citrago]|uniref:hypothetical protein n=1 Tax=Alphaproteobacteria bacterium endosymbiont of Tiliacea citrago TaxID=3077944 RepID=UPI00313BB095